MSSSQPGPYDQQPGQPGQPGPYSAPPPPPFPPSVPPQGPYAPGGAGGYASPQGQPNPYAQGYGQPQQPYAYPPQGVPAGGSGSGGGRGRRAVLISVAAVVAAALAGFGIWAATGGLDGASYKLTAPATLPGGYQKQPDGTATSAARTTEEFRKAGVTDPVEVAGSYKAGYGPTVKTVSFQGVYGTVDDPSATVDAAFRSMATEVQQEQQAAGTGARTELVGSPQQVHPAGLGSGGVMKCQYLKFSVPVGSAGASSFRTPLCMWGDSSTVAMVAASDAQAVLSGKSASIDGTAKLAVQVRDRARVPEH